MKYYLFLHSDINKFVMNQENQLFLNNSRVLLLYP